MKTVAFSPNGQHIVSGSRDCTIRIWDAKTGNAVVRPLEGHTDWVNSVAYSPNGRYIASGSTDCTIRIWNAETGTGVGKPLDWQTPPVQSPVYSPDGQQIISRSSASTTHDISRYDSVQSSSFNPIHASFLAKPDQDGWVRDSEGGLLYWVPQDCYIGLHSPARLTIPPTSRNRSISLDFDNFTFGTSWTRILKMHLPNPFPTESCARSLEYQLLLQSLGSLYH